jgi:hypothetical protein
MNSIDEINKKLSQSSYKKEFKQKYKTLTWFVNNEGVPIRKELRNILNDLASENFDIRNYKNSGFERYSDLLDQSNFNKENKDYPTTDEETIESTTKDPKENTLKRKKLMKKRKKKLMMMKK